jgi:hypothetical protein
MGEAEARAIRQDDEWRLMKLVPGQKVQREVFACAIYFVLLAADLQRAPLLSLLIPYLRSGPQLSMNFPHQAKTEA